MAQGRQVTRNDVKKAIERNLHVWSRWRTMVNDKLIAAMVYSRGKISHIPDLNDIINSRTPYDSEDDLHVNDPRSLLAYAPRHDNGLAPFAYLCYGIPRARVNMPQDMKQQDYSIEDEVDDIYAGYPFLPYESQQRPVSPQPRAASPPPPRPY